MSTPPSVWTPGSTSTVVLGAAPTLRGHADRALQFVARTCAHGAHLPLYLSVVLATAPYPKPVPALSPPVRAWPRREHEQEELGNHRDLTAEAALRHAATIAPSTESRVLADHTGTPWLDVAREAWTAVAVETARRAHRAMVWGQDEYVPPAPGDRTT